jgi:hypothetical protein
MDAVLIGLASWLSDNSRTSRSIWRVSVIACSTRYGLRSAEEPGSARWRQQQQWARKAEILNKTLSPVSKNGRWFALKKKLTSKNTSLLALLIIFFWARGRAAGLSRGILPGAVSLSYQYQPPYRAQKGYPAHIPRARRDPQQLILVQPRLAHQ